MRLSCSRLPGFWSSSLDAPRVLPTTPTRCSRTWPGSSVGSGARPTPFAPGGGGDDTSIAVGGIYSDRKRCIQGDGVIALWSRREMVRKGKTGGICLSYSHKRRDPKGNANKTRSRMEDAKGYGDCREIGSRSRGSRRDVRKVLKRTRGVSISGTGRECGVAVTSELTTSLASFRVHRRILRGISSFSLQIVLLKVVVSL